MSWDVDYHLSKLEHHSGSEWMKRPTGGSSVRSCKAILDRSQRSVRTMHSTMHLVSLIQVACLVLIVVVVAGIVWWLS